MPYKYLFFNDYSEGAHPQILDALQATNVRQEMGYGEDSFCAEAIRLIQKAVNNSTAEVHFVSGGTQANLVILGAILKPYESVIAAPSAHIAVHEAGAIEATGHKINVARSDSGKISSEDIRTLVAEHADEHMVKPAAVFIAQPTELGTLYNKNELTEISKTCKELGLLLYLDGARLGSALAAVGNDVDLADVAALVDIFYIGGTKSGALFGEAIVITNDSLKDHFRYHLKQRGALLAKGRVAGIQFRELFTDNLLMEAGKHANSMAQALSEGIKACGYGCASESATNQIFPILPNRIIEELQKKYGFYVWSKADNDHSVIRMVTSWATEPEAVHGFIEDLRNLQHD